MAARDLDGMKELVLGEIYGREGKLEITGLGGSYGFESLTFYRMLPGMRPPYCGKPKRLDSFQRSTKVRRPIGDAVEAVRSMSVIERMYQGASR
jgi:hypothetical protein